MVKKTLVTELRAMIQNYHLQERPFSLVMLIPTEPTLLNSRSTIVVSAPWLDEYSPGKAINLILYNLIDQLGSTKSPIYDKIARISVIHSTDRFVEELTSAFQVDIMADGNELIIQNLTISGAHIERATILGTQQLLVYA